MLFPDGTRKLEEMIELPCTCPVCVRSSVESLSEFHKAGDYKPIALHNLYVNFAEIAAIKEAIFEGRLWEYVEMRARAHPNLLSALKRLRKYKSYLERFENISKDSAFFYTGPESLLYGSRIGPSPYCLSVREEILSKVHPPKNPDPGGIRRGWKTLFQIL
jgi:7-cyano-7-deazaguanine tRNA-ribosyltransferase